MKHPDTDSKLRKCKIVNIVLAVVIVVLILVICIAIPLVAMDDGELMQTASVQSSYP